MTPFIKPFNSSAEEIEDNRDVVTLQVVEAQIAGLRKFARTIIERREDRKARRQAWRKEIPHKAQLLAFTDRLLDDVWRCYFGRTYVEKTQGDLAYELVVKAVYRDLLRDGEMVIQVVQLDGAGIPTPERRFVMVPSGV